MFFSNYMEMLAISSSSGRPDDNNAMKKYLKDRANALNKSDQYKDLRDTIALVNKANDCNLAIVKFLAEEIRLGNVVANTVAIEMRTQGQKDQQQFCVRIIYSITSGKDVHHSHKFESIIQENLVTAADYQAKRLRGNFTSDYDYHHELKVERCQLKSFKYLPQQVTSAARANTHSINP